MKEWLISLAVTLVFIALIPFAVVGILLNRAIDRDFR